jgi:hypothetical protein
MDATAACAAVVIEHKQRNGLEDPERAISKDRAPGLVVKETT